MKRPQATIAGMGSAYVVLLDGRQIGGTATSYAAACAKANHAERKARPVVDRLCKCCGSRFRSRAPRRLCAPCNDFAAGAMI